MNRRLRADPAGLPPREQARHLAVVVQPLIAKIERTEPDAREGEAVLAAIRAWGEGERLTGRGFSDLIYDDAERGTLRRLSAAADKPSEGAWNALTTAAMYVAWLVTRETGEPMASDVNEVDEGALDLLEEQLGAVG